MPRPRSKFADIGSILTGFATGSIIVGYAGTTSVPHFMTALGIFLLSAAWVAAMFEVLREYDEWKR